MPNFTKYYADKRAFIDALLPLLQELDFVFTDEKQKNLHRKETIYERKGVYYSAMPSYFGEFHGKPPIVEFRIHAYDQDPRMARTRPGTDECCFVYIRATYERNLSRHDLVVDGYFIESYRKTPLQREKCLYCGYTRGVHQPRHDTTKKHIANRARVESELAGAAKIPVDCMREILEYL